MENKTHNIKIKTSYYNAVRFGFKKFEVRHNDRDYKKGDLVIMEEVDEDEYTGRTIEMIISYVLYGGSYGIDESYCIFNWDIVGY